MICGEGLAQEDMGAAQAKEYLELTLELLDVLYAVIEKMELGMRRQLTLH